MKILTPTLFLLLLILGCNNEHKISGTYELDIEHFKNSSSKSSEMDIEKVFYFSSDSAFERVTINDHDRYNKYAFVVIGDTLIFKKDSIKKGELIINNDSTLEDSNGLYILHKKNDKDYKLLKKGYKEHQKNIAVGEYLDKSFTIDANNFGYLNDTDQIGFEFNIANKRERLIRAFKFDFLIHDLLEKKLAFWEDIMIDDEIPEGDSIVIYYAFPYNRNDAGHVKVTNSDSDKLVFRAAINEILFDDGEILKREKNY